ncbi:MAG: acetate--CoA ligase, partial [Candidatus Electrothrix sp. LOE1_4_5]|nr:acetate--CoA ligase [Candidatus Electrothrix gigas]
DLPGISAHEPQGVGVVTPQRQTISGNGFPGATLILLDGQKINTPMTDYAYLTTVPIHAVERIEVIRGPFSSLYGSSAGGGIINVITKDGGGKKNYVTPWGQAGSFGRSDYGLDMGLNWERFSLGLFIDHKQVDNYYLYEDQGLAGSDSVESCIVVERAGNDITMQEGRDTWWHDEVAAKDISSECEPESMDAEDILFILYTSGSTGTPKGVVHTTGGYLTYAMHTCQWVFDLKDDDVYWCTADIGWITGHSYILYGPLGLGATSLMFEGVPSYPGPDRFWKIVEKFKVNIFYTAPTVIRALMREGEEPVQRYDLSSLRILGSVGEPINPEAWMWYYVNIGKEKLPIVDTWWQTETGGIMISPLPYATTLKPGSATYPLPGIDAAIYDEDGNEAAPNEGGHLVIRKPWPGMLRGVYKNPERFKKTYFNRYKDTYDPEDGARKDEDGCFWIMGRLDDVINVSGHRLGTAEIESALVSHDAVAEAAVVGMPHPVKGQTIFAYVTLMASVEESEELIAELRKHVRAEIGPIATPEVIMWAPGLPKTRSGKIMRRILRKIAADDFDNFGDTSTLADPSVVDNLVEGRKGM